MLTTKRSFLKQILKLPVVLLKLLMTILLLIPVFAFMAITIAKYVVIPALILGAIIGNVFEIDIEQALIWSFIPLFMVGATIFVYTWVKDYKVSEIYKHHGYASCPKCGAPMQIRIARKGRHAGKSFLGCSKYPACKKIVDL